MPASSNPIPEAPSEAKCFGLRIENTTLQVAIATPMDDGRYQLEIDEIRCPASTGWLTASGAPLLVEAFETLVERHDMRRHRVAISLDGHYCVTRVTMGSTEEVDRELSMQAERIPRYLQLGPGEKVTGSSRKRISPAIDYVVMGVVNRSLIQLIYDALREAEIEVTWVEPSLVSVARMLGQAQVGGDKPVMIADGTGSQWDVGIACSGRLLLDYRPAAATDEEGLRKALDGHITRLQRFCLRHRGIATGEMNRLMICGSGEKPQRAVEIIGATLGVQPEVLRVPNLTGLYVLDVEKRQSHSVPAVATVLPLLMGVDGADVPDLLTEVRRAPELPLVRRALQTFWPAAAALLILLGCYGLVSGQRRHRAGTAQGRAEIEAQIKATSARFAQLTAQRELLGHLQRIESQTREADWNETLKRITQSLPASARLNEYRVEPDGGILLDGTVLDETVVYELVNTLRKLPTIQQVALKGTAPGDAVQGSRFVLGLSTATAQASSSIDTVETVDFETGGPR